MTTDDIAVAATPPPSAATAAQPIAGGPPATPGAGQETRTPRTRDRYLDFLRAVALVRVVTYHTFGWAWLSLLFPSMGVMFALAGLLMARSLDRPALSVIRGRMRRLLVPLWAFGAVVVTAMLLHGWGPGRDADPVAWWARLAFWFVPLEDPPATPWAAQVVDPLWYVRTYLWLVLLSPLLLRLFRKRPWICIAGFLVATAVLQAGVLAWPTSLEGLETAVTDFATFGACWLLGFAHRDGLVDRMPAEAVAVIAMVTMAAGGWFAFTHPTDEGYDLGEIPLGQALWSFGFVLLLLRFRPRPVRALSGTGPLARTITLLNARAVTVYLWHEVALVVSVPVIDLLWNVPAFEEYLPLDAAWFQYLVTWPLIGVAVLAFGWIEDLAARRRPRLWP